MLPSGGAYLLLLFFGRITLVFSHCKVCLFLSFGLFEIFHLNCIYAFAVFKYEKISVVIMHYLIKMYTLCNSYLLPIGSIIPITSWVNKKSLLQRVCCQSKKHATTTKITIPKMPWNASKWIITSESINLA